MSATNVLSVLVSLTVNTSLCSLPSYLESLGSLTVIPVFFSSGVSGPSGTIDLGFTVNVPAFLVIL